jgi:hypothetical protein
MGRGARLLAVAVAAGSHLVLVRLWVGDRDDEQRRKRAHNAPRACPLCTPCPARSGPRPKGCSPWPEAPNDRPP